MPARRRLPDQAGIGRRLLVRLAGPAAAALALLGCLASAPGRASASSSSCPGAQVRPGGQNIGHADRAILCLVNARRAQAGLPALQSDSALGEAASRHSNDMVARHYFGHESLSSISPDAHTRALCQTACAFAQNIAWGVGTQGTPAGLVAEWMASSPHRATILDPHMRLTGIGVAFATPDGQQPGATVTEDFAG